MLLFVDTETSGLLKQNLPLSDPCQPWACVVAAELTDAAGNSMEFFSAKVRAEGRKICPEATAVHGISSREADKSGLNEIIVLGHLCGLANQAVRVIGFGLDFDRKIIEGCIMRAGKDTRYWLRAGLEFVDVMKAATPFCRIEPKTPRSDGGYKWPTLDEACRILLDEPPRTGPHQAWGDMKKAQALYFNLRDRGAFTEEELNNARHT